jgi:hypothetical protein
MSNNKVAVSRPMVGVLALGCLATAGAIWAIAPDSQETQLWLAGFIRVGLVLSALWIALPTRTREAAWANVSRGTMIGIVLGVIALARLPLRVLLPLAVAVSIIGFTLRPRAKKRPTARNASHPSSATEPKKAKTVGTQSQDSAGP